MSPQWAAIRKLGPLPLGRVDSFRLKKGTHVGSKTFFFTTDFPFYSGFRFTAKLSRSPHRGWAAGLRGRAGPNPR